MAARNNRHQENYDIPATALYGSAAVDFDSLPEYMPGSAAPQPQYPEYEPQEPIRIKRVQGHAIQEKRSYKPGVSAFTVLGCLALAVVTVFVLLANARLTQITAEYAQLREEHQQLAEENRVLTVQYEAAFEPAALEDYVIRQLGMAKPTAVQVSCLPDYTEDKVVILDQNLGRSSLKQEIDSFFKALLEYIA